jgi:hypothetical protein
MTARAFIRAVRLEANARRRGDLLAAAIQSARIRAAVAILPARQRSTKP